MTGHKNRCLERVCALMIGVAILLSGCRSSPPEAAAQAGVSPVDAESFEEFIELQQSQPVYDRTFMTNMQNVLAECMVARGFEYVPFVGSIDTEPSDTPIADSVATSLENLLRQQQGLAPTGEDPNLQLMAQYRGDVYNTAFYGPEGSPPAFEDATADSARIDDDALNFDNADLGCQDIASLQVQRELGLDQKWAAEKDFYDSYNGYLSSDPRVMQAQELLASCTREQGGDAVSALLDGAIAAALQQDDLTESAATSAIAEVSEIELDLNAIEATCRTQTNYTTTMRQAEADAYAKVRPNG